MTPLLFAAALVVSPAMAQSGQPLEFKFQLGKPALQAETCAKRAIQTLGPTDHRIQKLSELPPGLVEHAVFRVVNGCPVREIVYAGQTYYLDAPTAGLQRLDPAVPTTEKR